MLNYLKKWISMPKMHQKMNICSYILDIAPKQPIEQNLQIKTIRTRSEAVFKDSTFIIDLLPSQFNINQRII